MDKKGVIFLTALAILAGFLAKIVVSSSVVAVPGAKRWESHLTGHSFALSPDPYSWPGVSGDRILTAEFSWHVAPSSANPAGLRVSVADETGNEYDPMIHYTAGHDVDEQGNGKWSQEIPVFPRRGKAVRIILRSADLRLGEFSIPNPVPGPHPDWRPEPLPITAVSPGLEVTLTRFQAHQASRRASAPGSLSSRTECLFSISEAGQPTMDWVPNSFEIADATGNRWRAMPEPMAAAAAGGNVSAVLLGALWAGEAAWRIKVEFKRVAHYKEAELLRVADIPLPAAKEIARPHTHHERNGEEFEVTAVIGTEVEWERIVSLNTDKRPGCVTVVLSAPDLAPGKHLAFVAATDDQGRSVPLVGTRELGGPGSTVPFSLMFQPPSGGRGLNLVIAVSESHSFTFLAKPEQVKE